MKDVTEYWWILMECNANTESTEKHRAMKVFKRHNAGAHVFVSDASRGVYQPETFAKQLLLHGARLIGPDGNSTVIPPHGINELKFVKSDEQTFKENPLRIEVL